jgi:putative mycofactocin binding protein MftB
MMEPDFDLDRRWGVTASVSIRPESFGALVYDFSTRNLSFLKTPKLVRLVQSLGHHPTARAACDAVGVDAAEMPSYQRALATLAASGVIVHRIET